MSYAYPTVRYRCEHCRRNYSTRGSASRHESKCWKNPANRACLTCAHYDVGPYNEVGCAIGLGTTTTEGYGDMIEYVFGIESNCAGWVSQ